MAKQERRVRATSTSPPAGMSHKCGLRQPAGGYGPVGGRTSWLSLRSSYPRRARTSPSIIGFWTHCRVETTDSFQRLTKIPSRMRAQPNNFAPFINGPRRLNLSAGRSFGVLDANQRNSRRCRWARSWCLLRPRSALSAPCATEPSARFQHLQDLVYIVPNSN